ncbi:MAG TPA: HAMP domain-containing sensor histidine kinase [Bacteroidota bacterium]|nr:HAMP domain-containing sensor histidine kinase [Bacteroidota bacterium]
MHNPESHIIEQELTRLLFEDASALLLLLDVERRIVRASASFERVVGRNVRGASVYDFIVDFDGSLDVATLADGSAEGHILHVSGADGMPESYRFRARSMGDHLLLYGESPDSDIRKLRRELLTANNELHDMARELQKRNAQLEEMNKLKNQFLGIAAHDLRNPISVILSFSELMLHDDVESLTDAQREMVDSVYESSVFMLKLLNNLLDISAIEAGKLTLDMLPTDIAVLLRKNLQRNRILAERKGIAIRDEIDADLPMLALDAGKFEQVLNNLITNAVKFSERGTTVTVRCERSDHEVVLSVRDQGQGIPAEELDRLFKPFSRTSVRATAGESSTGLGLAIVKRIIDGHAARVRVDSVVGQGTVFSISLPIPSEVA